MEGEGTYTYKNGDVYSGSFRAGKKDGPGVLVFKVWGSPPSTLSAPRLSPMNRQPRPTRSTHRHPAHTPLPKCQADGCQLHGAWQGGEFVDGQWVCRDGSLFRGSFEASRPVRGAGVQGPRGFRGQAAAGAAAAGAPRPLADATPCAYRPTRVPPAARPRRPPAQAQGCHFFSGSRLLQAGRYTAGGAWVGGEVRTGAAAEAQ
jgi:hypothetical protein